ncbi:MAG: hypothetical protein QN732_11855 [Nitrososphaeraceae archaeon]|nr:hypothetical protein [Nitrososphaeraceae archaeon]
MSEDSFKKVKKGLVETAGGLKDTVEGVTEGLVDTAQGAKETAEDVKEGLEGTAEDVKEGAEKVTDSDTYSSSYEERKSGEFKETGGKEPMNPEDIASHEPTAVKRDKKQGTSGDSV